MVYINRANKSQSLVVTGTKQALVRNSMLDIKSFKGNQMARVIEDIES